MSSRRPTTNQIRHARVMRPPDPEEIEQLETPPEEEDTDENHPTTPTTTSRTRTPADQLLVQLLRQLHANEDAAGIPTTYVLALEALAKRGREDRRALERDLLQAEERLAAQVAAIPLQPRRLVSVLKGLGLGSFVTGMVFVANLLIARGDAAATARQQAAEQRANVARLEAATIEIAALRAQMTGHDVLLKLLVRDVSTHKGGTP